MDEDAVAAARRERARAARERALAHHQRAANAAHRVHVERLPPRPRQAPVLPVPHMADIPPEEVRRIQNEIQPEVFALPPDGEEPNEEHIRMADRILEEHNNRMRQMHLAGLEPDFQQANREAIDIVRVEFELERRRAEVIREMEERRNPLPVMPVMPVNARDERARRRAQRQAAALEDSDEDDDDGAGIDEAIDELGDLERFRPQGPPRNAEELAEAIRNIERRLARLDPQVQEAFQRRDIVHFQAQRFQEQEARLMRHLERVNEEDRRMRILEQVDRNRDNANNQQAMIDEANEVYNRLILRQRQFREELRRLRLPRPPENPQPGDIELEVLRAQRRALEQIRNAGNRQAARIEELQARARGWHARVMDMGDLGAPRQLLIRDVIRNAENPRNQTGVITLENDTPAPIPLIDLEQHEMMYGGTGTINFKVDFNVAVPCDVEFPAYIGSYGQLYIPPFGNDYLKWTIRQVRTWVKMFCPPGDAIRRIHFNGKKLHKIADKSINNSTLRLPEHVYRKIQENAAALRNNFFGYTHYAEERERDDFPPIGRGADWFRRFILEEN